MPYLHKGDVVFAKFPYEEDKTLKKSRPCLILAVDDKKQRFLASKITTAKLERFWAFHLNAGMADMESGFLRFESWINLNRREWLSISDYEFAIGRLKEEVLNKILEKFAALFKSV